MKRPENMYDQHGKLIKLNKELRCLKNPKATGEEDLGLEVGIIRGETILGEDSGLFNIPLSYTAVAKSDVLVYRITSQNLLSTWPKECINEMKVKVLDKYKLYYERLIKIESYLTQDKKNAHLISGSQQIEKHTIKNYPGGNIHIREALKKTHL